MFNFFGDHGHGHGGHGGPSEEVDTEKLYTTLGVSKKATPKEIKKAYRTKAMEHHPDKGGDPETFKEISKAYEILSNPEKRELYNNYGEKGVEQGGGGGGMDPSDIFGQFFGGGGGGGRRRGPRKGKDVLFRLKVTLEELYNGGTKNLRLTKQILCSGCDGKGGSSVESCTTCKGRGVRVVIRQVGPGMIQQMQARCDDCDGEGEICAAKDRCKVCNGAKTKKEKKTLEVHIDKGMAPGAKIVFKGESDQMPGILPGDVVVQLEEIPHKTFTRNKAHLFLKKKITLLEALTGFQYSITHLDGRVLVIKSQPGSIVKHKQVQAVREEGMPMHRSPFVRGNLYVEFDVAFPENGSLDAAACTKLASVLPKPPTAPKLPTPDGDKVEEVSLYEVDMEEERKRHKAEAKQQKGQYESDDEEEGRGGEQQCRAQ